MNKIRILSFIIAAVLLAEFLPPAAFEVKAAGGYYEITDVEGLKKMKDDLSGTYVLKNDISMGWNSWEPVGDEANPFTGRFEGNGHIIFDLEVEAVSENGNALAGFFGYTAHAVIQNLCIMDGSILAYTSNSSETRCFASAGGIAGSINDNTTISRCCFYGTIEAEGREVNYARTGGIASGVHSGSVVSDCFACADLTCSSGTANAMAGGICAWVSDSAVSRCYFEGNISIPDDCYTYAGGINASGNKDGRVEGCLSAADSVNLQAAGTDHCVYNPVGWFAGEYADNAYSGSILTTAEIIGDSSAQRISDENNLFSQELYEKLGWEFGPGNWIDTYQYPRLAGVGRRIIVGVDTLGYDNSGGINDEQYFDVIYPDETDSDMGSLREGMSDNEGLCFGMCALVETILNGDVDLEDISGADSIPDIRTGNEIYGISVGRFIRYLHVMQYDNDYKYYPADLETMERVFDAVKAYADGESDEVPILKVRSGVGKICHAVFSAMNFILRRVGEEELGFEYGHAIIGIDYNEYDDRTEILCYDPNRSQKEYAIVLEKASDGSFESWSFGYYGFVITLGSENEDAMLRCYPHPSDIYNDLMENRDSFRAGN